MKKLILVLASTALVGSAFGKLDRIYSTNSTWQVETIITNTGFSDITVDPAGAIYMARSDAGLGRAYRSGGTGAWVAQPDMENSLGNTGTGTYTAIDAFGDPNYTFQIDAAGLERTFYSNSTTNWVNEEIQTGSWTAVSVDHANKNFHLTFLAKPAGGLDRHLWSSGWQLNPDIGWANGASNLYLDVECKPGSANRVYVAGPAGLEEIYYFGGAWTHTPVITGTSLTCLAHDEASVWKMFAAKADGGLMHTYNTGPGTWFVENLPAEAGTNTYVDIAANPSEANSLFLINSAGGLEKSWWLGSGLGWDNEVIVADGGYVALAVYTNLNEVYAITGVSDLYAIWKEGYGVTNSLTDDDGDGLDNLTEYGLGGDPTNALDRGYATATLTDGVAMNYVYPMLSASNRGIAYSLETTDNLITGTWTNSDYSVSGTNENGYASGFDAVTNQLSTTVKDKQFIRLKIEEL